MLIKWKNCFGLILCFYLFGIITTTKGQVSFSIEVPSELTSLKLKEMWHPHLKQMLNDNNELEIIDNHRKIYQTSLLQLNKEGNFLSNDNSPKMQCGCRFIKIADPKLPLNSPSGSSMLEKNSNRETTKQETTRNELEDNRNDNDRNLPPYVKTLVENLKLNNILMNKIESTLENQQKMSSSVQQQTPMMNQLGLSLSQASIPQLLTSQNPLPMTLNNQIQLGYLNTNPQMLPFINSNIPIGYTNPQLVSNMNYLNNYSNYMK